MPTHPGHALPRPQLGGAALAVGLRVGDRGTHSTRTMMLAELATVLEAVGPNADREAHAVALIENDVTGKATASNRRLTNQRLGELYALDAAVPIYRVLRRVWATDPAGRPLSALLCALARDPLLRATADHVLALPIGSELVRGPFVDAIRAHVEGRLNDASLDKVARNTASSWTQSGHLAGRVRKLRRSVAASPGPVALALWLGAIEGRAGEELFTSLWMAIFDDARPLLIDATLRAKQYGLIGAAIAGNIVQIDVAPLDPPSRSSVRLGA